MIDNIYSEKILEYAAHISKIGRLNNPDATSKKRAHICGSTATVDLKVANHTVTDFAQEVRACVLGQAAASLLAYHIIGQTTQNLKLLREIIYQMLTEDGPLRQLHSKHFLACSPLKTIKHATHQRCLSLMP